MEKEKGKAWAAGICGALKEIVVDNQRTELRNWPIIVDYDYSCHPVEDEWVVIVLYDKASGAPQEKEAPVLLEGHPGLPVTMDNSAPWRGFLRSRLSLRPEDMAVIIPSRSGAGDPAADWEKFSPEEKKIWRFQIASWVETSRPLASMLAAPTEVAPVFSDRGHDNADQLFARLRQAVKEDEGLSGDGSALLDSVDEMERRIGDRRFVAAYQSFLDLSAGHDRLVARFARPLSKLLPE